MNPEQPKIGIIGGYGKFGGSLYKKFQEKGINPARSKDKSDNIAIAKESDLVALCVPPPQADKVIKEISSSCRDVLSFVAGLDTDVIRAQNVVRVTRAMADPYFCFLTYIGNSLIGARTAIQLPQFSTRLDSNHHMEEFTVDLGILLVLFSLKNYPDLYKAACGKFSEYFPEVDINEALIKNIPHINTGLIAPKKGLSEFLFNLLAQNKDLHYSELSRFAKIKLKSMLKR